MLCSVALLFIAPDLKLVSGIVITRAAAVKPGLYRLQDAGNGAIRLGKSGITVDFHGARIIGNPDQASAEGVGLLIKGLKNVTIKDATISGFRNNIRILDCENIRLDHCNIDRSRAIPIMDKAGKPLDEFLNIRNLNVWRTYGSGIWIENSRGCKVVNCRGSGAQNGVLLVSSDGNTIEDCDFSFNSGWGVGLVRSSRNDIIWNHADFVNRPWGGGWGGDSSGFAVVDGSNENYFVGNSFTHSGDGFFLTDRVNGGFDPATKAFKFQGSSNNNIVAYNDGSWSPANAFESTFSFGNIYYRNQANNSGYGFWMGYSSKSLVWQNTILRSRADGIAIEQGSQNRIIGNQIKDTAGVAVHLWAGTEPEHKTRPSDSNALISNKISRAAKAYSFENSTDTLLAGNIVQDAPIPPEAPVNSPTGGRSFYESEIWFKRTQALVSKKPKGWHFYRESLMPKGLEWVDTGRFSPIDFRTMLAAVHRKSESELWFTPVNPVRPDPSSSIEDNLPLKVVSHSPLVSLSPVPSQPEVTRITPKLDPGEVGGFIDPKVILGKHNWAQEISIPLFAADWLVRWVNWDRNRKLDDTAYWDSLFQKPLVERHQSDIAGYFAFKSQAPGIGTEYYAFEATTKVKLDRGTYRFNALPDDGLQVWFDDKLVIDAWRPTPGDLSAQVDAETGVHTIRVRYMQTWGHSYLNFAFRRLLP